MNAAISVFMDECSNNCGNRQMQQYLQVWTNAEIFVGMDECSNKCRDRQMQH